MSYIIPAFVFLVLSVGFVKKVNCFDAFKSGATEGAMTIIKLVPTLIGLITAVNVFRASGIMDYFSSACKPFFEFIGVDPVLTTMALVRPVSGSASLAVLKDIVNTCGADSRTAVAAAIMVGSTETILYTLTVYTSETKIRKVPNVVPAAVVSAVVSMLGAVIAAKFIV